MTKLNNPSRREFLKKGSLATLGLAGFAGAMSQGQAANVRRPASGKAKNVIFLVSDGMSAGTLAMADHFIRFRDGRPSHWINMYNTYPVNRGIMETASQNSVVTDSAAASSAWGCGQRVPNGRVNVAADGKELEPILSIAKRNGLRTGLVTSATVTHATPAGFAANGPNRGDQQLFAKQYYERGYDVLLGGGRSHFEASQRADDLDLPAMFQRGGYKYVTARPELLAISDRDEKILGLFTSGYLPYEIDRLNTEDKDRVPSLAEMSDVALRTLSRAGEGFILQIEAARVDHAAHSNDISGLIYDQIAFDDAIAVALSFYESNPDTLVIVTTDHGNGSPSLNGGNPLGANTLGKLVDFNRSGEFIRRGMSNNRNLKIATVKERFANHAKLKLSNSQAQAIVNHAKGAWKNPYQLMNILPVTIANVLANHLQISWSTRSHTSEFVELAGVGPGSEGIQAFTKNYELFDVMRRALDIT